MSDSRKLFAAKFDGECDCCGQIIWEGDGIGYLDGYDKPCCEDCWEEQRT